MDSKGISLDLRLRKRVSPDAFSGTAHPPDTSETVLEKEATKLTLQILQGEKSAPIAAPTVGDRAFLSRPAYQKANPDVWAAWAPFMDWLSEHSPERFAAICEAEEAIRELERQGITAGPEYEQACAELLWHFEEARRLKLSAEVKVWMQ